MSSAISAISAILIPGLIALVLYHFVTHILAPFLRRHRLTREYLPVPSFPHTETWHDRLPSHLAARVVPQSWLRYIKRRQVVDASAEVEGMGGYLVDGEDGDDNSTNHDGDGEVMVGEEEGERMVGVNMDARAREALARSDAVDVGGRLSRDLEEGFRDDSDEG